MKKIRWIALPALLGFVALSAQLRADDQAVAPTTQPIVPDTFMRFVDDGHGGGSFQTAEVQFRNANGVTVNLVGAIHIGEKSYYDDLNRQFKGFGAVLYEMIKANDVPPPAPGEDAKNSSSDMQNIHDFQRLMKDTLELDYQLDDINYTAPNFIHADLDVDTFERMQAERGQSFESLMFQQMMSAISNPPKDANDEQSVEDLVHVLARPDMKTQIKVVIARQLGDMDNAAMGLDGPAASVIVVERNKAALKVLSDTINNGTKNVAIFYGAAHMPDMSKRLEAMGFEPISLKWNSAWNLTIRADQPSAFERMLDGLFGDTTTRPADK